MTDEEDRRAQGLGRVTVRTLVEICGRDIGGAPAFEAEAIDVSGRGMHVRTAYLPEIGAPLVCRFEERGREIVVEGVVAWRKEEARGGEFGMKFTALDSGSVDALRDLCGLNDAAEPEARSEAHREPAPADEAPARSEQGARVRLHIDGLGSPMKASVRDGGTRKLQVASNLEFLKVGRHLEIEDLGAGMRRGAHIDAVNVVIDPSSQVPQLVVSLRYDDIDEITPEPSVIDNMPVTEGSPHAGLPMPMPMSMSGELDDAPASLDDARDDDVAGAELLPEDEIANEAGALRNRFGAAAVSAGAAAKTGGVQLARFGAAAAVGMGRLFRGASDKVLEMRRRRAADQAPKRMTSPPPGGAMSVEGRRLRPQSTAKPGEPQERAGGSRFATLASKPRARKVAALGGLAVLVLTVSVLALKKSPPPGADADAPSVSVAVAASGEAIEVDDQGNPIEKASDDKSKKLGEPGAGDKGVSADVPLFGPTPMATMEPAPLGAPPEAGEGEASTEEAAEKEKASVADELWPEEGESDKDKGESEKKASPSDVPPWGRGRLDTPVVHRLRLDGPGGAIQGAVNATGFSVVIPDRKVMESGSAIEQRDSRIARVKTRNGTSGAQISISFKDGVPGYRVRLRKDYVEFLISSEGSKSSTAAKTSTGSSSGKKKSGAKSKSSKSSSSGKKEKALATGGAKREKGSKKKRSKKSDD